jgi:8-oxo-dGTP diphosphatase
MKDRVTRVAAYGLLIRANRILLCRISSQLPHHAGTWTLPGGGAEFGEHPEQTMIREVEEETGYLVRSMGLAGIDSLIVEGEAADVHSIRLIFFAEIVSGTLSFESNGSTDGCDWHPIAGVGSLPVVELVRRGLDLMNRRAS